MITTLQPYRTNESVKLIKLSLWTFALSFALGTSLFIIIRHTSGIALLYIGSLYVLVALFANCIIAANNIINAAWYKLNRLKLVLCTLLLIVNIPIALFYISILLNK